MKKLALILGLMCGCEADPIEQRSSDNSEVNVAVLFRVDGCTVYRFWDGRSHYFARCPSGQSVASSHAESCGKNCTRVVTEEVPTAYAELRKEP